MAIKLALEALIGIGIDMCGLENVCEKRGAVYVRIVLGVGRIIHNSFNVVSIGSSCLNRL